MTQSGGDNAFTAQSLRGTVDELMFAGALSFGRRRYSRDLTGVDVAVTGIPLDIATSNRPGARFGPRAIRAASTNLAWERHWPWPFDPFERLSVVDCGDCQFDYGKPAGVADEIRAHVAAIIDSGAACLALGGDHFITLPILRAHHARHGRLALIHFDAHTDTWQDPEQRMDHGTMFFHAVGEGLVDPRRSAQIGIRTTNDDTLGFQIIDAREVHRSDPADIAARVRDIVAGLPVYLTFDIDCLDPAYAPGTGTPVCGGLSTAQAFEIVRGLAGLPFIGMDVTEVAPAYDVGEVTALAGATLAFEFLCLLAERPAVP